MVLMFITGSFFVRDTMGISPFAATGLQVADQAKVRLNRIVVVASILVALTLVVTFVLQLGNFYDKGALQLGNWYLNNIPMKEALNGPSAKIQHLKETGLLKRSEEASGLSKLSLLRFNSDVLTFLFVGLFLVVLVSMLRYRIRGFPIHPMLFIIMGTWGTGMVWASCFIGWLSKQMIMKFGGGRVYQLLKPLFLGLIAGDLFASGISFFVSSLYYLITKTVPPVWHMFP